MRKRREGVCIGREDRKGGKEEGIREGERD